MSRPARDWDGIVRPLKRGDQNGGTSKTMRTKMRGKDKVGAAVSTPPGSR